MRMVGAALALGLAVMPAAASAQGAPAQGASDQSAPTRGAAANPAAAAKPRAAQAAITRDAYVAQAKRRAEKRFDKMDANHDGVLSADERRAAREARSARRHHAQPAQ